MSKTMLLWLGTALAGAGYLRAAQQQESGSVPSPASSYRTVLNRYCIACHNEKLKTANLMLDKMDVENVPSGRETWEKVIRKLRTGGMPPAGLPRPDKATYNSFATYLETTIDAAAAANPNPGRPAVHRLNRTEYTNAIRDLLALEIDGESYLPADDSGYGFDNNADALSVSPLLLEKYMAAARKISRLAIGDREVHPDNQKYILKYQFTQEERMSEDLPFGTRGGTAFKYYFPSDGEYVITITLQKSESPLHAGSVVGLSEQHELLILVDGALVKRLTVGGEQVAKARATSAPADPHQEKAEFEVRFAAKAGAHVVGIAFPNDLLEPEAESEVVLRPPRPERNLYWKFQDGFPGVEIVSIGGPYDVKGVGDTASRAKIFVCHPTGPTDEEGCARKILSALARRAFRRPVTDAELQTLLRFYKMGRSNGDLEAGIGMGLRGLLISREFLFRGEANPQNTTQGGAHRISDLELASRLSFFLWSSIPDDPLLEVAERGKLKDPAVLEQQVRRMLADPRAKALMSSFFGQWIQLRNLDSVQPDTKEFPTFDDNLRTAFVQEMDLFLQSILREDRSLLDLLSANYTFVNDRLARHYGIPDVYGSHFRRVTLTDENRWGLLGKGSILTLTSLPNRTSPVQRGKFVLQSLMGTPPPPPPPNVPELKESSSDGKKLTMRQAMELHRANPVCAGCHSRMDPLGFALDNFDPIGRWRTTEANVPIDSSGALPDGTKFQGVAELRKLLVGDPDQFVNTVTENLLTYALGRTVSYLDQPAIRKIKRDAATSGYRWSSVILGIVSSEPFQMRKPEEPAPVASLR